MSKTECVACRHSIDAAARLCPYCGANPATGEKIDTEAVLREVFQPRNVKTSDSILEYARHRQGIVIAIGAFGAFLILAALHQYVTIRNNTAVSSGPAVPLSEIADLSDQSTEVQQLPMPAVEFQFTGQPQKMRTYVVEPGAVTPPEIVAAQQAAQLAAQQAAAQKAAAAAAARAGQKPAPAIGPTQKPMPVPARPPTQTPR